MQLPYILALPIVSLNICSCSSTYSDEGDYAVRGILSVTELLEKKHDFHGHNVTIAGYYDYHFEGSTLRSSNKDSSIGPLVPYYGEFPIIQRDGRIVYDINNKWNLEPILLTGRFWVTDHDYRGLTTKNVAILEPSMIISISHSEASKLIKPKMANKAQ